MSGTVPAKGSSMPASSKVVLVKATPTNYRPATDNTGTGIPETPLAAGAPDVAPSQTTTLTGEGPMTNDKEGLQGSVGLVPPPASHGDTGPQIASPSVNYDHNQESSIGKVVRHPTAITPLGQQDERT